MTTQTWYEMVAIAARCEDEFPELCPHGKVTDCDECVRRWSVVQRQLEQENTECPF